MYFANLLFSSADPQPANRRYYNATLNLVTLLLNLAWSVPGTQIYASQSEHSILSTWQWPANQNAVFYPRDSAKAAYWSIPGKLGI